MGIIINKGWKITADNTHVHMYVRFGIILKEHTYSVVFLNVP